MSLVGPGQLVTYTYWIEQVQRLGLGDTSTPGEDERRTFKESGEYILTFWNGSEYVPVHNYQIRKDIDDTFSGTLTSTRTAGSVLLWDNGSGGIFVHIGLGNVTLQSGLDENKTIINGDGASLIRLDETGNIEITVSEATEGNTFTTDMVFKVTGSEVTINDKPVLRGDYPNPAPISNRTISSKTITNGSYEDTGIPAGTAGTFILKNETDQVVGYFDLCCTGSTNVEEHLGNSAGGFFRNSDTAGYLCVFFYNGTLQVRNRTGSSKVISAGFYLI